MRLILPAPSTTGVNCMLTPNFLNSMMGRQYGVALKSDPVEVQVIAPNAVLWAIARANPADLEALGRVEGMDAFRLDQYGSSILEALQTIPGQQKLL